MLKGRMVAKENVRYWKFLRDRLSIALTAPFVMIAVAMLAGGLLGFLGLSMCLLALWITLIGLLIILLPRSCC